MDSTDFNDNVANCSAIYDIERDIEKLQNEFVNIMKELKNISDRIEKLENN